MGKVNSNKLEKLHVRAMRIIFDDYETPSDVLMSDNNILPLSTQRIKFLLVEVYKCMNGLNPEYLNVMFINKDISYNLRNNKIVKQNAFKTMTYGYRSFQCFGSKMWNALPIDIKNCESLPAFKCQIDHWIKTEEAVRLISF